RACGAPVGRHIWIRTMLPDLRLLILATVATFFVAAAAGLFGSVRVAQDSVVPHGDSESPINRIQSSWPMPETNRAAALQELLTLAKTTPMANVAERIVVPAALTVPPPPSDDSDGRPDLPPLAHEARHEEPTAAPPAEP